MKRLVQLLIVTVLSVTLTGCPFTFVLPSPTQQMTPAAYRDKSKGYVVLSIFWKRYWACGGFENAQLRGFGFDHMPLGKTTDESPADLLIEGSRWYAELPPVDYVLAVEPGEYALAGYLIKVARSASDIRYWAAGRSQLYKDGKALGGTFAVRAGETVYIGHFGLACGPGPSLWRYYVEGREAFEQYKKAIKNQYQYLDVNAVQYRLFETSKLGEDYKLPQ
jgi:hypothetical protein